MRKGFSGWHFFYNYNTAIGNKEYALCRMSIPDLNAVLLF